VVDFNRVVGVAQMPAAASTTDSNGAIAELFPGPRLLADIIKAGTNADLGARWSQAISSGCSELLSGSEPIRDTLVLPVEPTVKFFQTINLKFPALIIYPTERPTSKRATLRKVSHAQQWSADYILGPLLPDEVIRFGWALHFFPILIEEIARFGGHSAYAADSSGAPLGVLFEGTAGRPKFEKLTFAGSTGAGGATLEGTNDTYYASSVVIGTEIYDGVADRLANAAPYQRGKFNLTGDESGLPTDDNPDAGGVNLVDMFSTPPT
jgi:hypothetical protein